MAIGGNTRVHDAEGKELSKALAKVRGFNEGEQLIIDYLKKKMPDLDWKQLDLVAYHLFCPLQDAVRHAEGLGRVRGKEDARNELRRRLGL